MVATIKQHHVVAREPWIQKLSKDFLNMNKLKPKEELDDDELRRLQPVFGTAAFYASAPIETGRSAQVIQVCFIPEMY